MSSFNRFWQRWFAVPGRRLAKRTQATSDRYKSAFDLLPPNVQGMLWLLLATFFFSVMSTLVKYLGQTHSFSTFEIAFFRVAPGMVLALPFLIKAGPSSFITKQPLIMLTRVSATAIGLSANFYAMIKLPLADATALSFGRVLFVVPLAIIILKEVVGPRRLIATLVGFLGVVVMLRPGVNMNPDALYAVGGAFSIAIAMVLVKLLTRTDGPATLVFYASVFQTAVLAIPAFRDWITPTLDQLGLLLAMGVIGVIAQACFLRAYVVAEASVLAPVDYMRLLFAGIMGYMVFGNVPDQWTFVGSAIIIASTLYITLREAQKGQAQVPPVPPLGTRDSPVSLKEKNPDSAE